MRNKVLSVAACVAAVAASAIYYYSFVTWLPLLYGLSVALYALAAVLFFVLLLVCAGHVKGEYVPNARGLHRIPYDIEIR